MCRATDFCRALLRGTIDPHVAAVAEWGVSELTAKQYLAKLKFFVDCLLIVYPCTLAASSSLARLGTGWTANVHEIEII